jgi:hypothetical protein
MPNTLQAHVDLAVDLLQTACTSLKAGLTIDPSPEAAQELDRLQHALAVINHD